MSNSSPEYLHYLTEVISLPAEIVSFLLIQIDDQIKGDWKEDAAKTGKGIIYSPSKFYYQGDIV